MSITARFVGGPIDGQIRELPHPHDGICMPVITEIPQAVVEDPIFSGAIGAYMEYEVVTYVVTGREIQTGYYVYRVANADRPTDNRAPVITPTLDEGPGMLLEELLAEIDDVVGAD